MLAVIGLLLFVLILGGALALTWIAVEFTRMRRELASLCARLDGVERRVPGTTGWEASFPTIGAPVAEDAVPITEGAAPIAERAAPVPDTRLAPDVPAVVEADSLETRIGSQWLLYIGVLAILVGVAYFEKLAFENAWMGETARVVQGGAAGLLLVYAGTRFVRAGYSVYGQAIAGAGIAVMYVSAYASFNFYHLVSRPVAFAAMIAITLFGAALADRHQSQGLAVFAVGGGFLTPFLLPGTTDAQIALFGYDAILAAGAAFLARRRAWALLYATSYLFVLATIAAWGDRFYTPDKYLRTEIFITAFCAMFLYMLRQCRGAMNLGAQIARMFLLTAPIAYYVASVGLLFDHPAAMLIWLVALVTLGGVAAARQDAVAGEAIWIAAAVPLLAWCSVYASGGWMGAGLSATAGIYAIALASQLFVALPQGEPGAAVVAWLHLNGLVTFAGAYILLDANHSAWTAGLAAAFAAWQGAVAGALWRRRRALAAHFVALGLTLLAIAIALEFDGPAVTVGWGAEGFAAVVLGLRERRRWLRLAGLALVAIAVGRAEVLLFAEPRSGQLLLVNRRAACALFLIALAYAIAWLQARSDDVLARRWHVAAAIITAQVLTLSLVTSEIDAYGLQHQQGHARDVMLSVSWAAYATALILVGLRRRYAPVRIFAIVVLALTIVKVFAVDLSHLQRVYRVVSVIGLGIMLLATSYLYQRTRNAAAADPPQGRWPS